MFDLDLDFIYCVEAHENIKLWATSFGYKMQKERVYNCDEHQIEGTNIAYFLALVAGYLKGQLSQNVYIVLRSQTLSVEERV